MTATLLDRRPGMDSLGNLAVKEDGPMRIKEPAAANALLDLAMNCAADNRRLLYFCSFEFAGVRARRRLSPFGCRGPAFEGGQSQGPAGYGGGVTGR